MRPSIRALCGTLLVLLAGCGAARAVTGLPATVATGRELTISHGPAGGGLIVFGGVRWGTSTVSPRIYLVRADGGGLRRLTDTANVEDVDPAWRPDGRQIAFARRDARGWRLYVMSADGGRLRAISPTFSDARAPAWSPDGRRLVFVSLPLHPPTTGSLSEQIAVINADGSGLRILTRNTMFKGGAALPVWSPDGQTILFSGRMSLAQGARADVWSIRPDGSGLRRVIVDASDPAFSPDGHSIAFSRHGDLYTASSAGNLLRRLTRGYYADSAAPDWSPGGTQIAYATALYDKHQQQVGECLTIIDADGTHRHEITRRDPNFWATSPDWRPAS
jgi:Tol biopolymer transport system component